MEVDPFVRAAGSGVVHHAPLYFQYEDYGGEVVV